MVIAGFIDIILLVLYIRVYYLLIAIEAIHQKKKHTNYKTVPIIKLA